MNKMIYIKLIVLVCLMLLSSAAWGETVRFTGAVNNDWSNANNWTPRSPNNGDDVVINGGTLVVCSSFNNNIRSVTVEAGATLTVNTYCSVNNANGPLNVYGTLVVNNSLQCSQISVSQEGNVTVNGTASIGNDGSEIEGTLDAKDLNSNSLHVSETGKLTVTGNVGGNNNSAKFVVDGKVKIGGNYNSVPLQVNPNGSFVADGSILVQGGNGGALVVGGSVVAGKEVKSNPLTVSSTGSLKTGEGIEVNGGHGTMVIEGTVNAGGGLKCDPLTVSSTGMLTTGGSVEINGGHGKLDIAGSVNVQGELKCDPLTVSSTGSLETTGAVEINGGHGKVDVAGNVSVGGGLKCDPLIVEENASLSAVGNVEINGGHGSAVVSGNLNVGGGMVCSPLTVNSGASVVCDGDMNIGQNHGTLNLGGSLEVGGNYTSKEISVTDKNGAEFIVDLSKVNLTGLKHGQSIQDYLAEIGVSAVVVKTSSWTGATDSDWFNTANWGDMVVPTSAHKISIEGNSAHMPVIGDAALAVAREILIKDGATLTLNAGAMLDATYIKVENGSQAGAVVINQTHDKMVSVHLNSSIRNVNYGASGVYYNKTVVNTTYPGNRYMYVGSETAEGSISVSGGAMFYLHDHATDAYNPAGSYTNPFNQAGILANVGDSFSATQTGTIVPAGSRSLEVRQHKIHNSGNTWCLLSNPFSFAYPLSSLSCDANVDPVIWFDNYTGGGYQFSTYSVSTKEGVNMGASTVMAPQQAFFVKASESAPEFSYGVLKFNDVSGGSLQASSLKAESIVDDVLRLTIASDGKNTDEMAMVFRDGGSLDVVYGDAEKMALDKGLNQIYAVKGRKRMAIPYYPEADEVRDVTLPVGVQLSSATGEATLTATNIGMFRGDVDVYLTDNLTGDVINLREQVSYQFEEVGGKNIADRFTITLKADETATAVKAETSEEVSVFGSNGSIVVRTSAGAYAENATIKVYDIYGRVVSQTEPAGVITTIAVKSKGMYVVEVINNKQTSAAKVLVM